MHHRISTSENYAKEKKTRSDDLIQSSWKFRKFWNNLQWQDDEKWLLGVKENADYKHYHSIFQIHILKIINVTQFAFIAET